MTFESRLDLLRAFDESLNASNIVNSDSGEGSLNGLSHKHDEDPLEEPLDQGEEDDLEGPLEEPLEESLEEPLEESLSVAASEAPQEKKPEHAADLYRDMKPKFDLLDALTDNVIHELVVQRLQKVAAE